MENSGNYPIFVYIYYKIVNYHDSLINLQYIVIYIFTENVVPKGQSNPELPGAL